MQIILERFIKFIIMLHKAYFSNQFRRNEKSAKSTPNLPTISERMKSWKSPNRTTKTLLATQTIDKLIDSNKIDINDSPSSSRTLTIEDIEAFENGRSRQSDPGIVAWTEWPNYGLLQKIPEAIWCILTVVDHPRSNWGSLKVLGKLRGAHSKRKIRLKDHERSPTNGEWGLMAFKSTKYQNHWRIIFHDAFRVQYCIQLQWRQQR